MPDRFQLEIGSFEVPFSLKELLLLWAKGVPQHLCHSALYCEQGDQMLEDKRKSPGLKGQGIFPRSAPH